ncbi:MAG TPA: carotenoid oxygenase family protein [Acidimicrobiales bacterium]|nr:carotenoid oxygenase family protein [Acidimicrobiales bacterium]
MARGALGALGLAALSGASGAIAGRGEAVDDDPRLRITDRDVVFWEMPVLFSMDDAIKMIQHPESGALPFRWDPSYGSRVGVMPLGGPASAMRWVEIEPCYVYHGVNAHRDGHDVVLDVCRLDSTFAPATAESSLTLHRWRIDTSGAQLRFSDQRLDSPPADLPTIDRRRTGVAQRHAWLAPTRPRRGHDRPRRHGAPRPPHRSGQPVGSGSGALGRRMALRRRRRQGGPSPRCTCR